jgi:hypothetical protein
MKNFISLMMLPISCLHADLALTPAPVTRGEPNTAFAIFDSLEGLSSNNATGTSSADSFFQLTDAVLTQDTPVSPPGGLKFNTASDRRVYTFSSATEWTITATADIAYRSAALRIHEYGSSSRGDGTNPVGLTDYFFKLNDSAPTKASATAYVFDEGTDLERTEYVTTVTWQLSESTNELNLSISGYESSHDSIDSFVLDLDDTTPVAMPELTIVQHDGEIQLSWPADTNAILQRTTSDAIQDDWSTVDTVPVQDGERMSVTLPLSDTTTFFRLQG